MTDIIIVGAGASGMMASIAAARNGAKVLLLERLNRVGKKLLVTGNGRCNLSNTRIHSCYYHTSSKQDFSYPLKYMPYEKTRAFFEALGILPLVEGEKVYPFSEQASSVLEVLRMEIERLGVELKTDTKITKIFKQHAKWHVVSEEGITYCAAKVIIATGGMANASFGCDDAGYNMLKKAGHSITPVFPTLVHVLSPSPYCKMMKGTKITCDAAIYVEDNEIRKEHGEVLFTEDGLSGPPIFQLSRVAAQANLEEKKAYMALDLLPHMHHDEVISTLYGRIAAWPRRTVEELFIGWLHKRITVPIIKCAQIASVHLACEDLEYDSIARLAEVIKKFIFETRGTRGFKFAQVTAGGVKLDEIDLTTMESKIAKGLYITGEVLDVDGDCGGYNLQWAWATGYLAGFHASDGNEEKV